MQYLPFQYVYSNKENFFLVADYENRVIRKITMDGNGIIINTITMTLSQFLSGTVSTFAGSGKDLTKDGSRIAASFRSPHGIAINQLTGDIYASEYFGHVIRKISPQGIHSSCWF